MRERMPVDLVAVSGGWSPAVHLFSQSGGKLRWDDDLAAFVPRTAGSAQHLAGALTGERTLAAALGSGHRAGVAAAAAFDRRVDIAAPRARQAVAPARPHSVWYLKLPRTRQWID